jgi:hypothetical protein
MLLINPVNLMDNDFMLLPTQTKAEEYVHNKPRFKYK